MVKVKNADYEEYRRYRDNLAKGRIINPDGLKMICESNGMDPENVGRYFLEILEKFKADGVVK